MRGHKRLFGALVALMATIAMVCSVASPAYAERYSYTVRVFQGNGGKLKSDPVSITVEKGGRVDLFDFATADVSDSKYVQIGFRLSGEDEVIGNGVVNGVIEHGQSQPAEKYGTGITQDMDFVVAYGVKGETVKYTLKFVEYGTGRELAEPKTYYGRIGDKPVVAYEYIEGYRPLYYSITGTLKENEEDNVWTFEYVALQEGETAGSETTTTTETTVPGNETVTNEGTTTVPGETTTTTRTETIPGTTTTEPGTTTNTTSPATTGGTTTTPANAGGGTTAAPSTTTTTTTRTETIPVTTTTPANAGGNAVTTAPSDAGGNDAAAAPSDAGNAGNAGANANAGGAGANANGATTGGGNENAAAQESAPATREILDMDTPLAGPGSSDTDTLSGAAASTTNAGTNVGFSVFLALLVAAALAAGYYFWKRKQREFEDEPEPEE